MTISQYLETVKSRYASGISREHSYRGDFENLFKTLVQDVTITNEPANVTDCGNPDYVITKGKIPLGYIEAKDVGKDLNSKSYKEQFGRYKNALDNLIITDYLWFQFFEHGELVHEIRIARLEGDRVVTLPENFERFEHLLQDFATFIGQTIKSPKKLAIMMAAKARLLQDILEKAVTSDEVTQQNTSLKGQYETFKQILIHDLTPKSFADIYAQTLAYGMFAARLHDSSLEDFSRQEAAELIPKSNPFLRKLFGYVAGPDIDDRIRTTVDNLAEVFRATNIEQLLKNFGASTQQQDPIIHFYEDFLAEYDPKLRKSRGVWYTPEPVVKFIVRAVDDVLKTEFGLPMGLADTSKTKIKVNTQMPDKRSSTGYRQEDKEVHKVQILDPATGTGTFLAEVIRYIYNGHFKAMQGAWSGYVQEHLIPRLNGFELLMASYAMAHLKLDMLLRETGYNSDTNQRLNVFLTNSLEEYHPDTGTLFANWLSTEASEANTIKRDTPVMCVIGNPPYSGESAKKGKWIMNLMGDYKKEPGGKQKLKERNAKWINDDYVKFIRFGQYFLEKNGEGVLAFINPHGFLDNPTFRGMRWHLLKTYDKIYTIDLHGNSNKKEVAPDGSTDINIFDIEQGVSINVFVKNGKKRSNELGKCFHYDLYGLRSVKYNFLIQNCLGDIPFVEIPNRPPMYYMVQKDFEKESEYEKGFSLNELFLSISTGVVTARDKLTIRDSKNEVMNTVCDFVNLDVEDARIKYSLGKDARDWKVSLAQKDLIDTNISKENVVKIAYRPFDEKWTYYTGRSKGFHCMPRGANMSNFVQKQNIGLVFRRQQPKSRDLYIFCCKNIVADGYIRSDNKGGESIAPLYIYTDSKDQQIIHDSGERSPNLNTGILKEFTSRLSLKYVQEKISDRQSFAPIDILDYIYSVLHSPVYREKYKEFLKIDFPRVPYPEEKEGFWQLVLLGRQLRQIHLLESSKVNDSITTYPNEGTNKVTRKMTKNSIGWEAVDNIGEIGKVWINDQQYFEGVPLTVWEFYIGGHQPAQKWLKDRYGRVLSFEDLLHYQKIIVALNETKKLMQEIDALGINW